MSIPVFLINLDKRTDRLRYVSEQLLTLKVPFERISAVDSSLLPDETTLFNKEKFIIHNKKPV